MQYLNVKNWEEFQHYKDRNPPWIKLHRALLDNYEFCSLQDSQKGHLVLIWIHASQNGGRVPNDKKFLEQKLSCKGLDLDVFVRTGFLIPEQDASTMLADCMQDAPMSVRLEEKRREEDIKQQSLEILNYLNEKADRAFDPVKSNLKFISGRLEDGASVEECKAVIDAKVIEWAEDKKMSEYLRPETLFNATKFASYKGNLRNAVPVWERP